jgi:ornithine cyclodeaminase/alanine dehydrogenase-like protein (mu-crystallin family)
MRFLTEDDVLRALDPSMLIDSVEMAFGTMRDHVLRMPERTHLELANGGVALMMPCYDEVHGAGVKIVGFSSEAGVQATYLLLDHRTGAVAAIFPANTLTDMRTAAVSALATDQLARSDARTLGIFGTGRQARAHVRILPHVRDFDRVLVCGSRPEKSRGFAQELAKCGLRAIAAEPQECASADVVCTCTTSVTPVLLGEWLRPGTHVNAVGTFRPDTRELDTAAVQRARVFVDTYDGALAEAGDILLPMAERAIPPEHICGDLHEVISCKKNGRTADDEITVFKSVGCALADLAAAQLLLATLESEAGGD